MLDIVTCLAAGGVLHSDISLPHVDGAGGEGCHPARGVRRHPLLHHPPVGQTGQSRGEWWGVRAGRGEGRHPAQGDVERNTIIPFIILINC